MSRSRAEIEADLERLQSELSETDESLDDTLDEIGDVVEEAIEAHTEAVEDAAEEVAEEIADAVEDAAEETVGESALTDDPDVIEDEIAARVIEILASKYNLHPVVTEEVVMADEPAITHSPVGEHFKYRKVF